MHPTPFSEKVFQPWFNFHPKGHEIKGSEQPGAQYHSGSPRHEQLSALSLHTGVHSVDNSLIVVILSLCLAALVLVAFFLLSYRDKPKKPMNLGDTSHERQVNLPHEISHARGSRVTVARGGSLLLPQVVEGAEQCLMIRVGAKVGEYGSIAKESGQRLAAFRVRKADVYSSLISLLFESPVGIPAVLGEVEVSAEGLAIAPARLLRFERSSGKPILVATLELAKHMTLERFNVLVKDGTTGRVPLVLETSPCLEIIEIRSLDTDALGGSSRIAQCQRHQGGVRINMSAGVDAGLLVCAFVVGQVLLAPYARKSVGPPRSSISEAEAQSSGDHVES